MKKNRLFFGIITILVIVGMLFVTCDSGSSTADGEGSDVVTGGQGRGNRSPATPGVQIFTDDVYTIIITQNLKTKARYVAQSGDTYEVYKEDVGLISSGTVEITEKGGVTTLNFIPSPTLEGAEPFTATIQNGQLDITDGSITGKGGKTYDIGTLYEQDYSPYWNADMIKAQYLTDLNIAFALIDDDDQHTIYIPELRPLGGGEPMFSNIWQEVAKLKAKFPSLKVNISVGGWGADNFSDMADDDDLRAQFVAGVCQWLKDYDLDGVDIDWEYPVGPDWWWNEEGVFEGPISVQEADAENYITLLRDLRDALDELGATTGKYYSVSTAVPASGWFLEAIDVIAVAEIVDALKLMAYDYYGDWSATTGHLANIFNTPEDPEEWSWSTDQALEEYLDYGVPPEKIQMGFAFYGRAFGGVEPGPNGDGLFQEYSYIPGVEGEVTRTQIKEYLQPDSGFTRYWDDVAKAPYLYNGDVWITYCDEQFIQELVAYSKRKGLGGFFSWEYGTDMDASLLKALSDSAGNGKVVSSYLRTWPLAPEDQVR